MKPKESQKPISRVRLATLSLTAATVVGAIFFGVQRPSSIEVPGVVVSADPVTVRPPTPGFISHVFVGDGQVVRDGDVLMTLDNPSLIEQAERLELEWVQNELAARQDHQAGETAAWQARQERGAALRRRIAETRDSLNELTVRATADGMVVWPTPDTWTGRYLSSGEAVCRIEPIGDREIVAVIRQDQLAEMTQASDWRCRIDGLKATWTLAGVAEPDPRAIRQLPHRSLGADAGGSVTVRSDGRDGVEMAEPHLRLRVALPDETAASVPSGTRVLIKAASHRTVLQDVRDALPML